MKKIKSIIVPIALLASVMTIASCSGKVKDADDPTKTNIHIYNFDGGVGTDWLKNAATRFESKYASKSFETGKTGVKVHVTATKSAIDNLATSNYNVIFTEGQNYNDLINQNQILDITDIVKGSSLEDVSDGSEKVTIESKMTAEQQSAYQINGKYYVLPHYETYSGLTYDKDVFKKKSLYIKAGGGYCNGTDKSVLSVGPNGVKGDYDDGLPSSIEEFFALMDRMCTMNVVPFIWSGQYASYLNHLVIGTWVQMEGKDRFSLAYNFDSNKTGETVLNNTLSIDLETGKKTVTDEEISKSTGYKAHYQEGKYYGYKMVEKILSNPKYYSDKITTVLSHLDAQEEFINSDLENNPIAMFIDGSYWYNEAKDAINRSVKTYGEEVANRNFAWMPLPSTIEGQVKEGEGKQNTMISSLLARGFINANVTKDAAVTEVSKLFLKSMYTQVELENFTKDTGCSKGVNYTISDSTKNGLSKYAQSLLELKAKSEIIDPVDNNNIFIYNAANFSFSCISNVWKINFNGSTYLSIKDCLANGGTAEKAFMGGITKEEWEKAYSKYFN